VDRRNNALSAALEQQRQLLTAQVVGAIVLAVLLAFCFGCGCRARWRGWSRPSAGWATTA
jgi:hypothetical protein